MKKSTILINIQIVILMALTCAMPARAFAPDTYAENSRLAEGTWVKVSVKETGIHVIPVSTLREWGFTDPSRVRIYGYGGGRISDVFSRVNYIDDLPLVQSVQTSGGIVFYAVGTFAATEPDKEGFSSHVRNPWDNYGYYFVTESDEPLREIPAEGRGATGGAGTFMSYACHEIDRVSPGESGHLLLGEDFRYNNRNTFSIDLPGRVEGTPVNISTRFFTFATSGNPTLSLSLTGTSGATLSVSSKRLPLTSVSTYGDSCLIRSVATGLSGNRLSLTLAYSNSGVTRLANLDNIGVNYERAISLSGVNTLVFSTDKPSISLSGATERTKVWDVTDPLKIKVINHSLNGGKASWASDYTTRRTYAAFNEGAAASVPAFVERISNQNIHAEPVPDMVIVTSGAMRTQAERIADFHRNSADSLRVFVVNKDKVWNEFGSGVADINAVRRMLKMFYDRGTSADGHRLQFVLMMGRPFYDHRHLTEYMASGGFDNMPIWQSDSGHNESLSYSSDDILTFLEDNSGMSLSTDKLCIAVGRIAARTAEDARVYVDKLMNYHKRMPEGDWKNKVIILADDQDNGIHLTQAEALIAQMEASPSGNDFMANKVYIDAYEKVNGVTQDGRTQMYKWLDEGAMWWMYIGHASIDTWTTEGMLTRTDIVNNLYYRRLPILYAATCSFSRWDGSDDSGAEMMVGNSGGGVIASICPVRPVYISSNGVFSRNMGSTFLERDENGRFLPIGEIVRRAKNLGSVDSNKLRYVIIGDPAMRVPMPDNRVILESINGEAIDSENQPTIMARQRPVFEGYIADWQGNPLTDFNGTLYLTIYDAEESVTTLGRGDDSDPGKEDVFERQGGKLYTGRDRIVNGRFSTTVAMPSEIAWNYRNAAVNMYAVSEDSNHEAMGCNRNFYVYGYDESETDDKSPSIDALYLNHESFANGDVVNESPMMFAEVSDDIGINLSSAGIGQTLLMRIDDAEGFTDVSDYYIPASDGTPSGTVAYPIEHLEPGNHTLTFRVWDTSRNFAQSTIEFYVQPGLAPKIFDVYTDASPATTEANFYVRHNRPDATLTVAISVYDLQGREVWSGSATGRSDMFVTSPITWNLTDRAGRRVPRSIYVYRASVTTDGEQHSTESKRIAVAAL